MQAQVVLERIGFAPGVIDGRMGLSTVNALKGFQETRGLSVSGEFDDATKQALSQWKAITATRVVTLPADFIDEPFNAIPEDRKQQAKLRTLGYESLGEKIAERFHTTEAVLAELNPGLLEGSSASRRSPVATPQDTDAPPPAPTIAYRAGMKLRVPNVGADQFDPARVDDAAWGNTLRMLGVGTAQPQAASIEVDKSDGVLRVLDGQGKLIAQFTATMGSSQFPLPLGTWEIKGEAYNPDWAYDPALLANAPKNDPKLTIPAGPNNPVGVVWIDLSKEHYGIHGTDAPDRIGRAESNGCIRLTNWDAARLALMVKPGTKALFKP
jgi:lipoprotein-anchoring transpeptidase ErfK/SrfK